MEWIDEAIVLSARPHGENSTVVVLLTETYGVHAGLVAGGQGGRGQALYQPGNRIKARWRGRLAEQLGYFQSDLRTSHAASWLDNPIVLGMIASACAVTEAALPERQPMPGIFRALTALLQIGDADLWPPAYIKWEMGLLEALGYGMDLSPCAANGGTDNLAYVSPRTGRAVSREAGMPYHEKLFPLPGFLIGAPRNAGDIADGLALTGHFFARHVFINPHSRRLIAQAGDLPLARQRLAEFYPPVTLENGDRDETQTRAS